MARFCDSGRQPSDSDRLNMYTKNAIMSSRGGGEAEMEGRVLGRRKGDD